MAARTWLDRGGAQRDLMEPNGWKSPQMLTRYGAHGARRPPEADLRSAGMIHRGVEALRRLPGDADRLPGPRATGG
jgi:hypothetical protein